MPPQDKKNNNSSQKTSKNNSSSNVSDSNVFGDVAVRRANRLTGNGGSSSGSAYSIPKVGEGGFFHLLSQGGNLIDRINSGVGNFIDRSFDNTLGELIYNGSGQAIDPRKWLSGDSVATGLDIIEDLALLAAGAPGALAAGGKALLQNSGSLEEAASGRDLETGEELSNKQKALKAGTALGNIALMAAPGIGKLAGKGAAKAIAEADKAKKGAEIAERVNPQMTENANKAQALRDMNAAAKSANGLQQGTYNVALNEEAIKGAEKYGADYLRGIDDFSSHYGRASTTGAKGNPTAQAVFSRGTTNIIDDFSRGNIGREEAINMLEAQKAAVDTTANIKKGTKEGIKKEIDKSIAYLKDEKKVAELGDRQAFKEARDKARAEAANNLAPGQTLSDDEVMRILARENAASEFDAAKEILEGEQKYNNAIFNVIEGLGNTTWKKGRNSRILRPFGGYGARQGASLRNRAADFAKTLRENPSEAAYKLTKRGREEGPLKGIGIENDADMINSIINKVRSKERLAPAEERYLEAVEMGRRESSNELADLLHGKIVEGKNIEGDEALKAFSEALEKAKTVTKEGAEEGLASKGSKLGKTGLFKNAGLAKVPGNLVANAGNMYANYAAENGADSNVFDMIARDPQLLSQLVLTSLVGPIGGNRLYGKLGGTTFSGYRTGPAAYSAARLTAPNSVAVPRMVAASEAGRMEQARQEMEDDNGRTRQSLRDALAAIVNGDIGAYARNYYNE